MEYTPRQADAFLAIVSHRRRQELSELLSLHYVATQGGDKAVREQLKKWEA